MKSPTPPGVPVIIHDPFCRVWPWLQKATRRRTENYRSEVLLLWRTSPFTIVSKDRSLASPATAGLTRHGPSGVYWSNDLLNDY